MFYFWATFSDAGMKYGMSHSDQEKVNYDANNNVYLNGNFMNNNLATFSGGANNQKGTVLFEFGDKNDIINIKVTFEGGTGGVNNDTGKPFDGFDGQPIDCKLRQEKYNKINIR